MGNEADEVLLSFMNLLTAELQIEEIFSFDEVRYLLPILIKMIQTGELTFKCDFNFTFKDAFEFIKNDFGEKAVQLLKPEIADEEGDKQEIENIVFALLFIFKGKQRNKFDKICEKLDGKIFTKMMEMLKILENFDNSSPIPFSSILTDFSSQHLGTNVQIFSSSFQQKENNQEINLYKIKATEFEIKYKQVELINNKLNEQLGNAQNDFIDLENNFENLKQAEIEKQGSIDLLNIQLREITDELETSRYNNSQLSRELKSLNDRHTRAFQKSANDLKSKEDEVRLLYFRLDALIKQITEKDSLENKLKFLEQQISNQQGTIGELRIGFEQALDRANIAETELLKFKRLQINNISREDDVINSQNDSDNSISLHDDLNSCRITENHSDLLNSFDHSQSGEFAKLKTRLELIQYEKKELEKSNEEFKIKLDEFNNSQSHSILEKAKEIERFKQECETYQNELKRTQQKEANLLEKNKNIEEENIQLKNNIKRLEESIDKASQVICEYSNAYSECSSSSAVDYLQIKHELNKLQTENERLISKMDQTRHEATQEQRLITQHWYQSQLDLFKARHYYGAPSCSMSSSMRSSLIDNNNCRSTTPNNNNNQQISSPPPLDENNKNSSSSQQKSFFKRTDMGNTTNFNYSPHR